MAWYEILGHSLWVGISWMLTALVAIGLSGALLMMIAQPFGEEGWIVSAFLVACLIFWQSWPASPLLCISALILAVCRKKPENLFSKAAYPITLGFTIGFGAVVGTTIFLKLFGADVGPGMIRSTEIWLFMRSREISSLAHLNLLQTVVILIGLVIVACATPLLKPVSRFKKVKRIVQVSSFATLALTSFTFGAIETSPQWQEQSRKDLAIRYDLSLKKQQAAAIRYAAAESVENSLPPSPHVTRLLAEYLNGPGGGPGWGPGQGPLPDPTRTGRWAAQSWSPPETYEDHLGPVNNETCAILVSSSEDTFTSDEEWSSVITDVQASEKIADSMSAIAAKETSVAAQMIVKKLAGLGVPHLEGFLGDYAKGLVDGIVEKAWGVIGKQITWFHDAGPLQRLKSFALAVRSRLKDICFGAFDKNPKDDFVVVRSKVSEISVSADETPEQRLVVTHLYEEFQAPPEHSNGIFAVLHESIELPLEERRVDFTHLLPGTKGAPSEEQKSGAGQTGESEVKTIEAPRIILVP